MEKAKFNYIASLLYDYPKLDKYIAEVTNEIMHPFNPIVDENIGGGKSNVMFNQAESLAITIATDNRLRALDRQKKKISECLSESDDLTNQIIESLYFKRFKTLDGVAYDIGCSPTQVKRLRLQFFELVAEKLKLF